VARLAAFDGLVGFAELLPDIPWEGNVVREKRINLVQFDPHIGTTVEKLGVKTGFTTGRLSALQVHYQAHVGKKVTHELNDMFEITSSGMSEFCAPGDGGALIVSVDPIEAIGILIAATSWDGRQQQALVAPLAYVLRQFELTWA
jgi:hypothetical protein